MTIADATGTHVASARGVYKTDGPDGETAWGPMIGGDPRDGTESERGNEDA